MENQITVLKFGGTSVGDFDKIRAIANYLKERINLGEKLVVVVSAMGKTTDHLLESVQQLSKTPKESALAMLLTTGEQQTISYLSIVLNDLNIAATALTGAQAGIKTKGHHLKSKIITIDSSLIKQKLEHNDCLIVAGFQGINEFNEMTTLGRGGSDTSAVALAASLNVPCEIYTDVAGVFGTDPRLYPNVKQLPQLSYEEMMEMSSLGAGVLETRSIEIAMNYQIPIYLAKTLSKQKGTWIMSQDEIIERKAVTGVALDQNMQYVTIHYPMNDARLIKMIFNALELGMINVDMISQIVNEEGLQISFTMKDTDTTQITKIFEEIKTTYPSLIYNMQSNYVKISVIGSGMKDMSGVASKVFITLIDEEIPFYQVTTSEISISYVIDKQHGKKAVQTLCEAFQI